VKHNEFIRRALGVPFVAHGRSWDGWDCWGAVWVYYRDVLGVHLPTLVDDYEAKDLRGTQDLGRLMVAVRDRPEWSPSPRPAPGDVATFAAGKTLFHVALMVDERRALHVQRKTLSTVEALRAPLWSRSLEGVYRHASRP